MGRETTNKAKEENEMKQKFFIPQYIIRNKNTKESINNEVYEHSSLATAILGQILGELGITEAKHSIYEIAEMKAKYVSEKEHKEWCYKYYPHRRYIAI
jgi:hypothetical protein